MEEREREGCALAKKLMASKSQTCAATDKEVTLNVCNVKRTKLCFYPYETVISESNMLIIQKVPMFYKMLHRAQ